MQDDPNADALSACLETIRAIEALPEDDPRHAALERAIAGLVKRKKKKRRAARRRETRAHDREVIDGCEAARTHLERSGHLLPAPASAIAERALRRARRCAICKTTYHHADAHYPHHCPSCAEIDAARRVQRADLRGRHALITGGRIKIGFRLALKLLRDGAAVIVTTRFPVDARARFMGEDDAASWLERLTILPLDLRDLPGLLRFTGALKERVSSLDVLVNNAAQTVRRPPSYYARWASVERRALPSSRAFAPGIPEPNDLARAASAPLHAFYHACLSEDPDAGSPEAALFSLDEEGLPRDLRATNSWTADASAVDPSELAEATVINALAPFLLTTGLLPLLRKSARPDRYVVHASAVEGQFEVRHKTANHPHTNMAKAALNMFTRTSAPKLAREGIYMSSVDTGWITNENPQSARDRQRQRGFRPPLDVEDGAARLYDPIVRGMNGDPSFGVLLKDYRVAPW